MRSCSVWTAICLFAFLLCESGLQAQPPGRPGGGQQGGGAGGQRGGPGQGRPGDRQPPGGQAGQPSPPWLAIFDADSDGVLSSDEIKNASAALLKLDRNKDGRLTVDEVVPTGGPAGGPPMGGPQGQFGPGGRGPGGPGQGAPGQGGPGGRGPGGGGAGGGGGRGGDPAQADAAFARQLMSLDADNDGLLKVAELPEHMHSAFESSDANKNGTLDKQELLVLASHFRREKLNPDGDIEMKNAPTQGATPGPPR